MAKLSGPLFSLGAHGSLGPRLCYQHRKSGAQVRFQKPQHDYENTARGLVRDAFRDAIVLWNSLPLAEHNYWVDIERNGYVDI